MPESVASQQVLTLSGQDEGVFHWGVNQTEMLADADRILLVHAEGWQ